MQCSLTSSTSSTFGETVPITVVALYFENKQRGISSNATSNLKNAVVCMKGAFRHLQSWPHTKREREREGELVCNHKYYTTEKEARPPETKQKRCRIVACLRLYFHTLSFHFLTTTTHHSTNTKSSLKANTESPGHHLHHNRHSPSHFQLHETKKRKP